MRSSQVDPIYLDNAATSFPKPETVYEAADRWLRQPGAAFQRGHHIGAMSTERMVTGCRHVVAELLNAGSADRIAFTSNCTDSLHLLLHGLIRTGDTVLSTTLDHNSVLRPLYQLSEKQEVTVLRSSFDSSTGLLNEEQYERLLQDNDVKVAVLNHASNVTGIVQPAKRLIEIAHRCGTLVVLDAAQTVGHIPIDLLDLKPDFVAAAGHKGLLGPLGTGIIYVAEGMEHQLTPVRTGGSGDNSQNRQHPSKMPQRLESGNLNVPGIAGLLAGVQWLQEESISSVQNQITGQERRLVTGLQQIDGVTVFCRADRNAGISGSTTGTVSLNLASMDCRELANVLDQSFAIQARAGLHCAPLAHEQLETLEAGGTLRLSPGPFTTDAEIESAVTAIAEIADSMSFC